MTACPGQGSFYSQGPCLSFIKPFSPVSKDTISRLVKVVLQSAGIDTSKYTAHSSRVASTSFCKAKGLNIAEIRSVQAGQNLALLPNPMRNLCMSLPTILAMWYYNSNLSCFFVTV